MTFVCRAADNWDVGREMAQPWAMCALASCLAGGTRAPGGGAQGRSPHRRAASTTPPRCVAQGDLASGGPRGRGQAARAPGARPGPAVQGAWQ